MYNIIDIKFFNEEQLNLAQARKLIRIIPTNYKFSINIMLVNVSQ